MSTQTNGSSPTNGTPASTQPQCTVPPVTVRHSIQELERRYNAGDKKPLEDVIRAWHGITKAPPPSDSCDPTASNPFFILGGYHGEPFIPRNDPSGQLYWGGYCDHGNVLFPTWHRAYLYHLEKALQKVVPGVGLPFFDETSRDALNNGVPKIFTQSHFELDGKQIKNPLKSFSFPEKVVDDVDDPSIGDPANLYTKPKGYETVRFPLSGLVGTPEAKKDTEAHNAQFTDEEATQWLNKNYRAWMHGINEDPKNDPSSALNATDLDPKYNGVYHQFVNCLTAPNYTVFSNTTSAGQWGKDHKHHTFALEAPHNDIHLAIGGYWYGTFEAGLISGANGDMGENNTAALDPIFFFHHCNIDRMFWLWQKRHGQIDNLDIYQDFSKFPNGYRGTNTSDIAQGPRTGENFGEVLTIESDLQPFKTLEGKQRYMTSKDVFNIESQLGYTYGPGSLDPDPTPAGKALKQIGTDLEDITKLHIHGIARTKYQGSFIIYVHVVVGTNSDGSEEMMLLGHYSVLNRNDPSKCANCQNHIPIDAFFPLFGEAETYYEKNKTLKASLTFGARDPNTGKKIPITASVEDFKYDVMDKDQ